MASKCQHHPDPRTYRDLTPVGCGPDEYTIKATVNCATCGAIGDVYFDIPHKNVEWEDGYLNNAK